MRHVLLYNPKAGAAHCLALSQQFASRWEAKDVVWVDRLTIDDMSAFIKTLLPDDEIILCGGDGTLQHFANAIDVNTIPQQVRYFPSGSCNDFAFDVRKPDKDGCYDLHVFMRHVPQAQIKNQKSKILNIKYLNGLGLGLDGDICARGQEWKEMHPGRQLSKLIYVQVALKSLFKTYQPCSATVRVDGKQYEFDNVWMAPCMNGRFFGGGVKCAPHQDRLNAQHTQTVIVAHTKHRVRALWLFAMALFGKHINYPDAVSQLQGNEIEVVFTAPQTVQVDGEVFPNILSYRVHSL